MTGRVVVLLLVAGLAFSGGTACAREAPPEPAAQPGPATCPEIFLPLHTAPPDGPPSPDRAGALVPTGGSTALLCVYPFPATNSPGGYRLARTLPLASDRVGGLLTYLNGLGPDDPATSACNLAGQTQYQIAIGYPDETNTVVRVDINCGLVSYAGAHRRVDSMRKLLDRWPGWR